MENKDMLEKDFKSLILYVKEDILKTRFEIQTHANIELIKLYFRIGKIISENAKYGNKFIRDFSTYLKLEFPAVTGFSERNLSRMKKIYEEYKDLSILPMSLAKLPWSHNMLLLDKIKDNCVEKDIEIAMLERIKNILLELGKGFCFVGSQYKISTDNQDYYIDLLFYHLDLNCYIVVELKNTEFKPEYAGQLSFYVTAVDETLKKERDNQTIGLLLCKGKDKLSVEWSLKSTNVPIGVSSYEIIKTLPKEVLAMLPTEEEINRHIINDNKI